MRMLDIAQRFGSGQAVRRIEDASLVQGLGQYTSDIAPAGQLRAVFLRSPHAHARIISIDVSRAAAMPGVVKAVTGTELLAAGVKPIPSLEGLPDGSPVDTPARPVLAYERVCYVGEAVALIVAQTVEQARDAAEAVRIEYEELPNVVDLDAAVADGVLPIGVGPKSNIAAEMRHGDPVKTAEAFAQAAYVVKLEVVNQRLAPLSIEPRAVVAWVAEDGRLTLHMSSQMPSGIRELLNVMLGIPIEQVRVTVGDVGGGFGMKTFIYAEDAAVAWTAWTLRRPVKWVPERSEEFLSAIHGRDQRAHAELALSRQGKILGLRVRTLANVGAYATRVGTMISLLIGPGIQTNVYHVPTIDFHFTGVRTNTMVISAYRGAGRPEAIYIMERLMDEAARVMGISPAELRRRNFIRPDQMPYTNAMGQQYNVGDFGKIMEQALVQADVRGFEARAAQSKKRGRLRGLGIASFLEWTGANQFKERVTVEVRPDWRDRGILRPRADGAGHRYLPGATGRGCI